MKLCICVDKKNGMTFGGRRQSQDFLQRAEMLSMIGKKRLWVSQYSSSLFDVSENIIVDDEFPTKVGDDDYCFVEDVMINIKLCDTVVLYKWNRLYPSDRVFCDNLDILGFKRTSKREFVGHSHEKITEEIYRKVN